jgi:hypothetical protein
MGVELEGCRSMDASIPIDIIISCGSFTTNEMFQIAAFECYLDPKYPSYLSPSLFDTPSCSYLAPLLFVSKSPFFPPI